AGRGGWRAALLHGPAGAAGGRRRPPPPSSPGGTRHVQVDGLGEALGSREPGADPVHLEHLVNGIGPRLTGSERLTKAVDLNVSRAPRTGRGWWAAAAARGTGGSVEQRCPPAATPG